MSRDIVPLGLRMPPDLKEQIEQAAKASGRSMNAEIVARLQASFEAGQDTSHMKAFFMETLQQAVDEIIKEQTGKKDD